MKSNRTLFRKWSVIFVYMLNVWMGYSALAQINHEEPTSAKSRFSASVDTIIKDGNSINNSPFVTIDFDKIQVCNGKLEREVRPFHYQLYPRNSNNMGKVTIAGSVIGSDAISFRVIKTAFNQIETTNYYQYLSPNGHFILDISIQAELAEYGFSYSTDGINWNIIADHVVCGDVYIISGQSNASADSDVQHEGQIDSLYGNCDENQYGKYGRTYKKWDINPNSGWSYSEVGGQYGVGVWGLKLQFELQKENRVPICIINGSVGGTGMDQHQIFLQDPFYYTFSPSQYLFGSLLTRAYYAGLQDDIKAIIWFNGEDECGSANPETGIYTREFEGLYNSCVEYLGSFSQIYVIQIASYTGPVAGIGFVSEDQRELPKYYDKLKIMSSNGIGKKNPEEGQHIHFSAEAYEVLGKRMFNLIEKDIYNNAQIDNPEPPNIIKARKEANRIWLDFDQILDSSKSDLLADVLSVIKFNVSDIAKYNAGILENSLFFDVDSSLVSFIEEVSYAGYLPNSDYNRKCYLRNSDSIAALSFYNFEITNGGNPFSIAVNALPSFDISISPNPVRDRTHILLPEGSGYSNIQLFNASMQLLVQDFVSEKDYSLNCSNLHSGIYILYITNKFGFAIKKVIVL